MLASDLKADRNGYLIHHMNGYRLKLNPWDVPSDGSLDRAIRHAIEAAGLDHLLGAPRSRKRTALYRHYDAKGRLLYVGISRSAAARLAQHSASRWDHLIARVEVEHFGSREQAIIAERQAIAQERPLYNKAHQPKSRPEPGANA